MFVVKFVVPTIVGVGETCDQLPPKLELDSNTKPARFVPQERTALFEATLKLKTGAGTGVIWIPSIQ